MKQVLGVVVLIVVAAVVVAGLAGRSGSTTGPGSSSVYREIAASSDCRDLQRMFDTAAANNDREPAGSPLFDATLSYMNAADDRMRELGCY